MKRNLWGKKIRVFIMAGILIFSGICSLGSGVAAATKRGEEEQKAYELTKKYESYLRQEPLDLKYPSKYFDSDKSTKKKLKTNNNKEVAIPAAYDSRSKGVISTVKDQGTTGTCWAHGILESAQAKYIATHSSNELDLSEWQLSYFMYQQPCDLLSLVNQDTVTAYYEDWGESYEPEKGSSEYYETGGNAWLSIFGLSRGIGTCYESDAEFTKLINTLNKGNNATLKDSECYLGNDFYLKGANIVSTSQTSVLKQTIIENGAGAISYESNASCYDFETYAYYNPDGYASNHIVAVVGWDDNYPKENFVCEPEHNGAWLIKNSWGTEWGNNGYFWMSYDEPSIKNSDVVFYEIEKNTYDNTYQYDGTLSTLTTDNSYSKMANIFEAKKNETLKAVSFHTVENDTDYKVSIYKNLTNNNNPESGTLVASGISGTAVMPGYYTVELEEEKYISLDKGDTFSIVVEESKDSANTYFYCDTDQDVGWEVSDSTSKAGESFVYDGSNWADISSDGNSNMRIKGFTTVIEDEIKVEDTLVFENDDYSIEANQAKQLKVFTSSDPNSPINEKVNLKFEADDCDIVSIDSLGNIYGKKAGTTAVTVSYGTEKTAQCTITVTSAGYTSISKLEEYATQDNPLKIFANTKCPLNLVKEPVNGSEVIDWEAERVEDDDYWGCNVDSKGVFESRYAGTYKVTATAISVTGEELQVEYYIEVSYDVESNIQESSHPYDNNSMKFFVYQGTEEQTGHLLTFSDDTFLEEDFDYLYIVDNADISDLNAIHAAIEYEDWDWDEDENYMGIQVYTGDDLAGETIAVKSKDFVLILLSDEGVAEYGFKIDNMEDYNPITQLECSSSELLINVSAQESILDNLVISPVDYHDILEFESLNKKILSVSKDGVITAKKAGTTEIDVYSKFNLDIYVTINVTVSANAIDAISFTETQLNLKRNATSQLLFNEDVSRYNIIYESKDSNIARVDEEGLVTAVGVGKTTISGYLENQPNIKAEMPVWVTAPTTMSVADMQSVHNYEYGMDEMYTYTDDTAGVECLKIYFDAATCLENETDCITILDKDGNKVGEDAYQHGSLSNTSIIVPGNTVTIRLQTGTYGSNDDEEYYCTGYGFRIKKIVAGKEATDISLSNITLDMNNYKQQQEKLRPELEPSDAIDIVSYEIADDTIAYVSDGIVYGIKEGTTTLTATTSSGVSKTIEVTVKGVAIESLFCTYDGEPIEQINIEMGEDVSLYFDISPKNYTEEIIVTSSNENVVTTDYSSGDCYGYLYGEGNGTATVTVRTASGSIVKQIKVICKANFGDYTDGNNGKAPYEMSLADFQSTHPYTDDLNRLWIYQNNNAETITIAFSDETSFEDGFDYLYIYDNNDKLIGKYTDKSLAGKTITILSTGFKLLFKTDESNQDYGFALTKLDVKLKTQVAPAPAPTPAPVTPQNVSVASITLSGESHNIAAGKKIKLSSIVMPQNATNSAITYTSSNSKYATVSNTGVVTTKKKGIGKTVTITATAVDGSGVKGTYKIKIMKKAVTSIKVSCKKTAKAGSKIKLKVTVTPKKYIYKKVAYKCLTPNYATVSNKGVVSIKKTAKGKTVKVQVQALDGSNKKKVVKIKVKKK